MACNLYIIGVSKPTFIIVVNDAVLSKIKKNLGQVGSGQLVYVIS